MQRSVLCAVVMLALSGCVSDPPGPSAEAKVSALEAAFRTFSRELEASGEFIRTHPFYRDKENRAAGFAFLSSMLIRTLEEEVTQDVAYPFFRVLDQRVREGGDNPDQTYLITPLEAGASYRLWGRMGGERRLEFQVYAGDPFVPGGGRMAAYLAAEDLALEPDGSFEIHLSPERRPGNWLENPADGSELLVRQIFSEWKGELPGEVHIDRVGLEGAAKPKLSEAAMAEKLERAAQTLARHVRIWPTFVQNNYLSKQAPNELTPPFDPGALGGVPGRFMATGTFELGPDEALLIRSWPASGNYQGIQLTDLWFSSLEYANRQTSLSGDQARLSSDGSYWFVISRRDPGVSNWLDTVGRKRGVILLRYDGMTESSFPPERIPTAHKVTLAELRQHLPADEPMFSPEQRAQQIALRRRAIQRRLGR